MTILEPDNTVFPQYDNWVESAFGPCYLPILPDGEFVTDGLEWERPEANVVGRWFSVGGKIKVNFYEEHKQAFVKGVSVECAAVKSSNITAIGYSAIFSVLEIRFKGDSVYRYMDVPETIWAGLVSADSFGKFFHQSIEGKYQHVKLN